MHGGSSAVEYEWFMSSKGASKMANGKLEQRLTALEAEVAELKRRMAAVDAEAPWWERIAGSFENDPHYEKAMRLGQQYRRSTRPKARPPRKK
jgi:hypothetical protein